MEREEVMLDPLVFFLQVFIESHDPRFPVIALFACRTIRAGEGKALYSSLLENPLKFIGFFLIEICWDYNYTVGCMPGIRIDCQCQASNCRGRLL